MFQRPIRHPVRRHALAIALAMLSTSFVAAAQDAAQAAAQAAAPATDPAAVVEAALQAAAPAKLAIAERFATQQDWAVDADAIGYRAPEGTPADVTIDHGTIAINFTAPAALAGNTLWLVPTDGGGGRVDWTCETTLPAGSKPEGCR